MFEPSTWNCTLAIVFPVPAEAVAATAIDPDTVEPEVGAVIATVGELGFEVIRGVISHFGDPFVPLNKMFDEVQDASNDARAVLYAVAPE
jgi:hypothetical protein